MMEFCFLNTQINKYKNQGQFSQCFLTLATHDYGNMSHQDYCYNSHLMTIDNPNYNSILVIIPVRNEEITITRVISSLQSLGLTNILVVDNGSLDSSAAQAQAAGAKVIYEPIPGYGKACWRALETLTPEVEWILFCDGDGSDDLQPLPQMLALRHNFDLILGNRRATATGRAALTSVQNFGNWLATALISCGWGYNYQDLGPLRLIRRAALEQMQMQDRSFGWTVEMQVKAIELGLNICELPVGYHPRQGGYSKISGTLSGSIQAGVVILSTVGKLYLRRIKFPHPLIPSLLLLVGAALILPYGDFSQPEAVPHFWLGIGVMSLGFILALTLRSLQAAWFWGIAILTRLLLIPLYPGGDVWRYLWEGYIQLQGFNPYDFAPNAAELVAYQTSWWSQINHPDVSAIYPPITQLGFRFLATIAPTVTIFKLAFVAADLMVCWLLSRRFGYQATLIYAWNPLIIYSFAGGAHYDSWFILPLVAAWLIFDYEGKSKSWLISALFLGISVAIKWISLPILAFMTWRSLNNRNWQFAATITICGLLPLILSSLPFCQGTSCHLIPTQSAFVSHGRSAELLPYLISQVWQASRWQNWLYLIPLGVTVLFLLWRIKSLGQFSEWYLVVVMLISPIIHAWYFTWLIPFAVASRNLGICLVSFSAFIYFALPYRQALGNYSWLLTPSERWWLWLPFILGLCWQIVKNSSHLKTR